MEQGNERATTLDTHQPKKQQNNLEDTVIQPVRGPGFSLRMEDV